MQFGAVQMLCLLHGLLKLLGKIQTDVKIAFIKNQHAGFMNLKINAGVRLKFGIPAQIFSFGRLRQHIYRSRITPRIHWRENTTTGPGGRLTGLLLIKNTDRAALFQELQRRHQSTNAGANHGNVLHCSGNILISCL